MKFKVGDRIRTLGFKDKYGNDRFPIGTIGVIGKICTSGSFNYRVDALDSYYMYDENELKFIGDGDIEAAKNQVWNLAKKLGSYDGDERVKIFGYSDAYHYGWVLNHYTPDEVIAKIEEYEKNHICVGDIVKHRSDTIEYIIINIDTGAAISTDFKICDHLALNNWDKTGRSINISDLVAVVNKDRLPALE